MLAGDRGEAVGSQLGESIPGGVGGGLGSIGGAGLTQDIAHVGGHRPDTDDQLFRDFPVGLASGDQAQYLHFPLG